MFWIHECLIYSITVAGRIFCWIMLVSYTNVLSTPVSHPLYYCSWAKMLLNNLGLATLDSYVNCWLVTVIPKLFIPQHKNSKYPWHILHPIFYLLPLVSLCPAAHLGTQFGNLWFGVWLIYARVPAWRDGDKQTVRWKPLKQWNLKIEPTSLICYPTFHWILPVSFTSIKQTSASSNVIGGMDYSRNEWTLLKQFHTSFGSCDYRNAKCKQIMHLEQKTHPSCSEHYG